MEVLRFYNLLRDSFSASVLCGSTTLSNLDLETLGGVREAHAMTSSSVCAQCQAQQNIDELLGTEA
jgi:hypothetical protein